MTEEKERCECEEECTCDEEQTGEQTGGDEDEEEGE